MKEMNVVMEQMQVLLEANLVYVVLGMAAIILILAVVIVINNCKINKMKKRYETFMQKEDINLEELLIQYTKKLNALLQNEKEMQDSIRYMESIVGSCVQKVGVVRYQAIQNVGADLSYTVALLDERDNGVVFNGIYGRDGCYTYAKPIENGKSTYNLSEEEVQAIDKAKGNKNNR